MHLNKHPITRQLVSTTLSIIALWSCFVVIPADSGDVVDLSLYSDLSGDQIELLNNLSRIASHAEPGSDTFTIELRFKSTFMEIIEDMQWIYSDMPNECRKGNVMRFSDF